MSSERPLKVLVYSDDRTTRESVRLALGKRPAADLPELEYDQPGERRRCVLAHYTTQAGFGRAVPLRVLSVTSAASRRAA